MYNRVKFVLKQMSKKRTIIKIRPIYRSFSSTNRPGSEPPNDNSWKWFWVTLISCNLINVQYHRQNINHDHEETMYIADE